MTYVLFALSITLNAVANILMKAGALDPKQSASAKDIVLNMAMNPFIITGILCFALGLAAYNYVLIRINLSVAYPINTSVGYVLVILASWIIFKENLSLLQLTGIACIIGGVWMVAQG